MLRRLAWIVIMVMICSPVYAWGYTGLHSAKDTLEVTQEDAATIDKTNKLLLVVQKQLKAMQDELAEKRGQGENQEAVLHYVSEDNALRYIASVLAYGDELGIPIDETAKRMEKIGVFKVHGKSSRGYLNTEEVKCVDFYEAKVYFPECTGRSIEAKALRIYMRLKELHSYRSRYAEAMQDEWQEQNNGKVPELSKTDLVFPLRISWWRDIVTSEFGDRDVDEINEELGGTVMSRNHAGLDIGCGEGTELYSSAFGQVVEVGDSEYGLGKSITIFHGNYTTVYGHLSEVYVEVGDYVYTDSLIGLTGSTGWSTGPHLHYELYSKGELLNPLEVFAE